MEFWTIMRVGWQCRVTVECWVSGSWTFSIIKLVPIYLNPGWYLPPILQNPIKSWRFTLVLSSLHLNPKPKVFRAKGWGLLSLRYVLKDELRISSGFPIAMKSSSWVVQLRFRVHAS